MQKVTMAKAINQVLLEEMEKDERIVALGEDIGEFGGSMGVTAGLYDKFGPERVLDTPIQEATIVGASVGMALVGLKPVCEMMFADFVGVAFDEIYNKMGKWRYMHGGYFDMPITLRLPTGIAGGAGPEHSQSPQALFMNSQGLYLVIPSTPYDAMGLLRTAIRGKDPVIFCEHKVLYGLAGEVPDEDYTIPFGKADIKHEGSDVTIVATSLQVHTALSAAKTLSKEGISAEVIDPRTIIPLDKETILGSVRKTGRLVIVHEEAKRGGTGAELAAIISEEALFDLKAPVKRVAAPDVPIAQSMYLEQFYVPSEQKIVQAVKEVMKY